MPSAGTTIPEQWDSSMENITSATKQLAGQDSAAAEQSSRAFEQVKQAAQVPQHRHLLHAHAIRCLLQQAADKIEADAETVKQVSCGSGGLCLSQFVDTFDMEL